MRTVVQYRLLGDPEIDEASELAIRVFKEFVALEQSFEGQEGFYRYATPNALRGRHRSGQCLTFVARRNRRLAGMLHLQNGTHVAMLFVEGASQRQGIGRGLLGVATDYALTRQPPIQVLTVASTPAALEAYQRLGFEAVAAEQVVNGIRFISMELKIGIKGRDSRDASAPFARHIPSASTSGLA